MLSENEEEKLLKEFNRAASWIYKEKKTAITADDLTDKHVQPLLNETCNVLNEAVRSGITHRIPAAMMQNLNENVHLFSGAKTYAELREMSALLLDDQQHIKSFHQYFQDVREVHKTYNQNYLQAEYLFAKSSAQMADKWHEFEQDGDRYDLQYRTASDDRVRDEHRILHDTTLPPSDPFWDKYMPPNGWRCRCTVVQVRKGKYPVSDSKTAAQKGVQATTGKNDIFQFNPGKQQVIFPKTHPYFERLKEKERTAIEKVYRKEKIKKLHNEAKETLIGQSARNEDLESLINFTNTGIKEYLNQPHKHYTEKNNLITEMLSILKDAKYLGESDFKNNEWIKASHIFETEIKGEKTWLIARENRNGVVEFYSISDSEKVTQNLKK